MNPAPSLQGALWSGNQQLATKKQLISSISGLYADIQDIGISSITVGDLKVSTLTVQNWISAPLLYVSDIKGANIDISGISITGDGILNAPIISLSSLGFKGFDSLLDLDISFDLGLGDAIGGLAAGLGALVGGAAIGVGTGVGLTVQGAEQGIATMVAGRPQNFITQNTYETINFTSQLQVSTLGSAEPAYSTIFRTVSSVSANQVPGREIFTSTIFYPGQICIRTVSDPFNLITGDSNLNTSTIQSFGQWTPLEGLEPENIICNGLEANTISTGQIYSVVSKTDVLDAYSVAASNLGVGQNAFFNYQAELDFQTGANSGASFIGYLNRLYCYNNTGYIFSGAGGTQESASLYLGSNTNESLLNISTINAVGDIKAVNLYASTITAEQLNVVSTLFLTSTNVEIITSTQTLVADNIYGLNVQLENLVSSVNFTTGVGNAKGAYDINKSYSLFSTSYSAVSSLTNNILNYNMNLTIQDQTSFNLNIAETNFGINYVMTPQNVSQWGSTLMIFNDYQNPGDIDCVGANLFSTAGITGTFDIQTQYNPGTPGYVQNFYITQRYSGTIGQASTIFQAVNAPNPPPNVPLYYTRYEIASDGYLRPTQQNPVPYQTNNTNTFTITQDINDLTIATTDRLNLNAGEIFLNGAINLNDINVNNLNANNFFTNSTTTTYLSEFIQTAKPLTNMISLSNTFSLGFVSSLASTNSQLMQNTQQDNINNYVSQTVANVNRPVLNLSFGTNNNIALGPLGAMGINGGPTDYNRPDLNWAFGTIVFDADDANFAIQLNGYGSVAVNGPVLNLSNAGAFNATLTIQGIAGTTTIGPGVGCTLRWNQTIYQPAQPFTAWSPYSINDSFQINQSYGITQFSTPTALFTGGIVANGNGVIDGALRTGGQITTFVPSGGYAGIEIVYYPDAPIWTFVGSPNAWESAAQNLIPRAAGGYYKSTDWTCVITVKAFTTPDTSSTQNSWTVYPVNQAVGGVNYLAIYRYLVINHVGPPSAGTFDVVCTLYPNNFTT